MTEPRDVAMCHERPTAARPLWIFALGPFVLVRDGLELAFQGRSPRKVLELLQALVAFGAHAVAIDALTRAVWPDQTSCDARNLFDNTLHRLRHLIDCPGVLVVADAKLGIDERRCWIDVHAFERLADPAKGAPGEHAVQALQLYRGHFLEHEPARAWSVVCRERLKRRLDTLILDSAARLEAACDWSGAAALYERGLQADPLAEGLYRRLMLCHHRCGEHAEALRVYRRCRDLLTAELGVGPSRATQAAAHELHRWAQPAPARP